MDTSSDFEPDPRHHSESMPKSRDPRPMGILPVANSTEPAGDAASETSRTPAPPPSNGLGGLYFLLASAALMFGIWFVGPRLVEEYQYASTIGKLRAEYENAVVQLEKKPLDKVSQAYQLVAQKVRPSVVSIRFSNSARTKQGLASGVILSKDGYIMTNAHVLEGASIFHAELLDRRKFVAQLVGQDPISDLAVLKINAPDLIPATWGNSDEADVGSIVWAIGSPYEFRQTVTSGILSGKDRQGDPAHPKHSLLQTDAAVNPGNSGGPLVDTEGRVIGINTSIYGDTFQGISFAVPSSTAQFVYKELIENGVVTRGYLGAYLEQVNHDDAVQLQLPDLDGAKLVSVVPNSPADRAGIQQADIIRSWDGIPIKEYKQIFYLAETTPPNTTVKLNLLRHGQQKTVDVTVGRLRQQLPQQ